MKLEVVVEFIIVEVCCFLIYVDFMYAHLMCVVVGHRNKRKRDAEGVFDEQVDATFAPPRKRRKLMRGKTVCHRATTRERREVQVADEDDGSMRAECIVVISSEDDDDERMSGDEAGCDYDDDADDDEDEDISRVAAAAACKQKHKKSRKSREEIIAVLERCNIKSCESTIDMFQIIQKHDTNDAQGAIDCMNELNKQYLNVKKVEIEKKCYTAFVNTLCDLDKSLVGEEQMHNAEYQLNITRDSLFRIFCNKLMAIQIHFLPSYLQGLINENPMGLSGLQRGLSYADIYRDGDEKYDEDRLEIYVLDKYHRRVRALDRFIYKQRFELFYDGKYEFGDHLYYNEERDLILRSLESGIKQIRDELLRQRMKGLQPDLDLKDKYIFYRDPNEPIEHLSYSISYRRLHGGSPVANCAALEQDG